MTWKLGIGGKLLAAFGTTFALALAAAGVGWLGFERVARTQHSVVNDAIPAMIEAHTLAEINARIIAAAPLLTSATTEAQRAGAAEAIARQTHLLHGLLASFERHGFSADKLAALKQTVGQIMDNLSRENDLVAERLALGERTAALTAQSLQAAAEITELSGSLVANAAATATAIASSLYDLVENPSRHEAAYEAFDRLVEVDIDSMERMFELRLRSSMIGAFINQLNKETDIAVIGKSQTELLRTLTILSRRIGDINDPGRQTQAEALLRQIADNSRPSAGNDLFTLRLKALATDAALARLNEENRFLAAKLSGIVADLVFEAGAVIDQATNAAGEAVRFGRTAFTLIAPVSLIAAALLLWVYVQQSVIRRLTDLDGAMRALADGNFAVTVQTSGGDELAKMADTVRVFKANAIEKQRLEQERERVATELRRYQTDLERLVRERTAQLRDANRRLASEAANHAQARAQAEKANRAKTAFLATISHEIRTPMSGMLGTLRLLADSPLGAEERGYVSVISSAGETLLEILNDILDYSKIEAGRLDFEQADFDLDQVVTNMLALMRCPAAEKGIILTAELDPAVPRILKGDPGKLRQVLLNLIGNAIKFTEYGGVLLCVCPQDSSIPGRIGLRFEVSDTGIGIPEEMREGIFEAFTQVDSSAARRYQGTGLGLAICKRLVTAMDGEIGVESAIGQGSLFWFVLSFETGERHNIEAAGHARLLARQDIPPLSVLLVEDNEVNRLVASSFLKREGHCVRVADNGREAIRALREAHFDAILMDISMPDMDGVQATRLIREMESIADVHVPIIAMSAHVFREEVEQYLAAGMDGFLGKPIDPARLNEALIQIVRSKTGLISLPEPDDASAGELLSRETLVQDLEALGPQKTGDMIDLFLETTSETVARLRRSVSAGDRRQASLLAHSLKGAAGSVGLSALHERAAALEGAAQEAEESRVRDLLAELESVYGRSRHALLDAWAALSADQGSDRAGS